MVLHGGAVEQEEGQHHLGRGVPVCLKGQDVEFHGQGVAFVQPRRDQGQGGGVALVAGVDRAEEVHLLPARAGDAEEHGVQVLRDLDGRLRGRRRLGRLRGGDGRRRDGKVGFRRCGLGRGVGGRRLPGLRRQRAGGGAGAEQGRQQAEGEQTDNRWFHSGFLQLGCAAPSGRPVRQTKQRSSLTGFRVPQVGQAQVSAARGVLQTWHQVRFSGFREPQARHLQVGTAWGRAARQITQNSAVTGLWEPQWGQVQAWTGVSWGA